MKELELTGKVKTNQRVKSQSNRNLASQLGISVSAVNCILKRKRAYETVLIYYVHIVF